MSSWDEFNGKLFHNMVLPQRGFVAYCLKNIRRNKFLKGISSNTNKTKLHDNEDTKERKNREGNLFNRHMVQDVFNAH